MHGDFGDRKISAPLCYPDPGREQRVAIPLCLLVGEGADKSAMMISWSAIQLSKNTNDFDMALQLSDTKYLQHSLTHISGWMWLVNG